MTTELSSEMKTSAVISGAESSAVDLEGSDDDAITE